MAADTFRHMFLFKVGRVWRLLPAIFRQFLCHLDLEVPFLFVAMHKQNFKRIHREGVLQKFIDDVLSGKLHQELHNPQMAKAPEHDPYGSEYDEYMDGAWGAG